MTQALAEPPSDAIPATQASFPQPLTNVSREAVKALSMGGMSDDEILDKFPDLKPVTLRQWRFRDPVWSALVSANRAKAVSQPPKSVIQREAVTAVTNAVNSSLQDIHAGTALSLAKATASELAKFSQKPAPVESWSDAKTAYSIQRLACGVDKEGQTVNVNLGMFSGDPVPEEGPVWEVETCGDSVDEPSDGSE